MRLLCGEWGIAFMEGYEAFEYGAAAKGSIREGSDAYKLATELGGRE